MFNVKSVFVPTALISTCLLGVSAANAENPPCYTLASLQGSYAIIGYYGSSLAMALSVRL